MVCLHPYVIDFSDVHAIFDKFSVVLRYAIIMQIKIIYKESLFSRNSENGHFFVIAEYRYMTDGTNVHLFGIGRKKT